MLYSVESGIRKSCFLYPFIVITSLWYIESIYIMWKTKRPDSLKLHSHRYLDEHRRRTAPTRLELVDRDGAIAYCRSRKLSKHATRRILRLVTSNVVDIDYRSWTIPKDDW